VRKTLLTSDQHAEIVAKFARDRSNYQRLVDEVIYSLSSRLSDTGIEPAALSGRAKTVDSVAEKLSRKSYTDPFIEIPDFAGVRVVCLFEADVSHVGRIVENVFDVIERVDKLEGLGADRMGYQGTHFVVSLGTDFAGPRYDQLQELLCEIQVRTVLQDAWALISHKLVYKHESAIPVLMRRSLNNVASLLEVAQSVFDTVQDQRKEYVADIHDKESVPEEFLAQSIDFDTLTAYTRRRYPDLPISELWQSQLIRDINRTRYRTLTDIESVIRRAEDAVHDYAQEVPEVFKTGTDFITKSLSFVDPDFLECHPVSETTRQAAQRLKHKVKAA
jgi:ppGpp synthetase/RelA/SpoT-type nucleotidyltranferase